MIVVVTLLPRAPFLPIGRAPALMDSLLESLTMAPLFVTIEATGKLGLMRDFHARVEPIVAANIAKFRAEQQQAKRAE